MKKINILFTHPLKGNAYELFKAFERHPGVNIEPLLTPMKVKMGVLYKVLFKLKLNQDIYQINKSLLMKNLSGFNIIFVDKGNEIKPSTLKAIKSKYPHIKIVNWSQDDMYAWHNRSILYTLGIKYYDLIITQKSYNVEELRKIGARKVLFQNKAYSQDIHKIHECKNKQKVDVLFIGFPEKERIKSILYLANNGIKVDIYGYPMVWKKFRYNIKHENISLHEKSLFGQDYAATLSCAKISLCFLRKANRDLQTSRSMEIPACGGFMVAERTNEHLELFEEDKEAIYFENDYELFEKVRYYLDDEEKRKKITKAGYKRCISSGYSYDDRVKEIIKKIDE